MNEKFQYMDKISVIVPVYNVAQYLSQCLDSILGQTYKNLQIILIDDGATDQSGMICDQYAQKDSRIEVVHQRNVGLAGARNAALDLVSGEYIAFVDSDDWIEIDMYENLYENLKKYDADISICDYVCNEGENKEKQAADQINLFNSQEAIEIMLKGKPFGAFVWNKIIKKSLVKDLQFQKVRFAEDVCFTWSVFDKATTIIYSDYCAYHYRKRENSLCSTAFNTNKLFEIEARRYVYEQTARIYPQLESIAYGRYMQSIVQNSIELVGVSNYKIEFLKFQILLRKEFTNLMNNKYLKKRFKKHSVLLMLPFCLCNKIYSIRLLNKKLLSFIKVRCITILRALKI